MRTVDDRIVAKIAEAIDGAEFGYSMKLVRLVDGESTYRVEIEGKVEHFTDNEERAIDQAYARIREVKQRKQAEAVISVLREFWT
ncbi:hypothetical protein V6767_20335 [Martelella sp. FLE1502]